MDFDPKAFGPKVAAILSLDGSGTRLMPLAHGSCSHNGARGMLESADAARLFSGARAPQAALCGLWVYFSCMDQAHELAQSIDTPEGSFWHAIVHRQEPDAGNSAYWFRRVGKHPIFPDLRREAAAHGVDFGQQWDPLAFIDYCERARTQPGSDQEKRALAIQLAEWQLLFRYCAANENKA